MTLAYRDTPTPGLGSRATPKFARFRYHIRHLNLSPTLFSHFLINRHFDRLDVFFFMHLYALLFSSFQLYAHQLKGVLVRPKTRSACTRY